MCEGVWVQRRCNCPLQNWPAFCKKPTTIHILQHPFEFCSGQLHRPVTNKRVFFFLKRLKHLNLSYQLIWAKNGMFATTFWEVPVIKVAVLYIDFRFMTGLCLKIGQISFCRFICSCCFTSIQLSPKLVQQSIAAAFDYITGFLAHKHWNVNDRITASVHLHIIQGSAGQDWVA